MYEQLFGKKITLRKAIDKDYKSMLVNVWGDEEIYRHMLFKPVFTEEDAKDRCRWSKEYQQDNYAYFVTLKDSDEAIGLCSINEYQQGHFEEAGICIGKSFQGKGYGKETLYLLLDLAFDKLAAKDFKYGCFRENVKSKSLAKHFGFNYKYTYSVTRTWDESKKTIDSYLLTRSEYYDNASRMESFLYT